MFHQAFFNHETHREFTLTINGPVDFSAIDPDIESFGREKITTTEMKTITVLVPIENYDTIASRLLKLKNVMQAGSSSFPFRPCT